MVLWIFEDGAPGHRSVINPYLGSEAILNLGWHAPEQMLRLASAPPEGHRGQFYSFQKWKENEKPKYEKEMLWI